MAARAPWRSSRSDQPRRATPQAVELAAGVVGPVQRQALALGGFLRRQGLGAHHQGGVHRAAGDGFAQAVQAVLRHVAAGVGVDMLAHRLRADAPRHAQRRVALPAKGAGKTRAGVGKQADDRQLVQRGQQGGTGAAVVCRCAGGGGHQVQRPQGRTRVGFTLGDLAHTDQHRLTVIGHVSSPWRASAIPPHEPGEANGRRGRALPGRWGRPLEGERRSRCGGGSFQLCTARCATRDA